jgi:hypothetical protein
MLTKKVTLFLVLDMSPNASQTLARSSHAIARGPDRQLRKVAHREKG